MISRDDVSAACKETLYCAEYKACFIRLVAAAFFAFSRWPRLRERGVSGVSWSNFLSRAHLAALTRERLSLVGGGRFRGMGGGGKSRRDTFAVGFFGRGFDGARARAKRRHEKTSFCGNPAFRFPINRARLSG